MPEEEDPFFYTKPVTFAGQPKVTPRFAEAMVHNGASLSFVQGLAGGEAADHLALVDDVRSLRSVYTEPRRGGSTQEAGSPLPRARCSADWRLSDGLVSLAGGEPDILRLLPRLRATFLNRSVFVLLSALVLAAGAFEVCVQIGLGLASSAILSAGSGALGIALNRFRAASATQMLSSRAVSVAFLFRLAAAAVPAFVLSYVLLLAAFSESVSAEVNLRAEINASEAAASAVSSQQPRLAEANRKVDLDNATLERIQRSLRSAQLDAERAALTDQLGAAGAAYRADLATRDALVARVNALARVSAAAARGDTGLAPRFTALREVLSSDPSLQALSWALQVAFVTLSVVPALSELLGARDRYRVYAMLLETRDSLALAHAKAALQLSAGSDGDAAVQVPLIEQFVEISDDAQQETLAKVIAFDGRRRAGR